MKQNGLIKFRHLFALLLALSMLPALFSCTDGKTDDSDTVPPETTEAPAASPLTLAEDGKVIARVIRGFNASDEEINAAMAVRQALLGLFPGSNVEIADDFSKDKTYNSDTVEILVGKTEYPQTTEAMKNLKYGDYGTVISGNKVLLISHASNTFPLLASNFCDVLRKSVSADKKSLVLSPDACSVDSFSRELNAVPVADAKLGTIISCGDSAYQLYFSPAQADDLDAYLGKLKSDGYTVTSDREVGSNRFCSLTSSSYAVTAYYTDTNKTVRVIVEPIANYYGVGTATSDKKVTPSVTMIGRRFSKTSTYLDCDAGAGLMCFLMQLSDGRFVVIDGGVSDGTEQSYSQALYSKMVELAPDKNNIVIAAWFFTHSHSDHIGGFRSFSVSYSGKVKLEAILNNFPSETDHKVSDEKNDYTNFRAALGYWPKAPPYKLHTGQRFAIRDAVFEV
ncbi:MAG: hypothetical protein MJ137_00815, partial [Clostridia bacterium]|nr:hypothetical protein [Clostridia bacterium]